MNRYKAFVIIAYPVIIWLVWIRNGGSPQIFTNISFQSILHGFILLIAFVVWVALTYALTTCLFSRWIIQRKLKQAERPLGHIATAKLVKYTPSKTGNYVTLRFCSAGIPEEEWERKRPAIQSAINYTIIDQIDHIEDDWGVIEFRARKGCPKANAEALYDEDF